MSVLPKDINWALSLNSDIVAILLTKYPPNHSYWTYLDTLVSDLRKAGCKAIQEKFVDVANNFSKFQSTIAELEIANILSQKGKQVELLTDTYLATKSPDMLVKDSNDEYYIEVMRFSDDETSAIILDGIRSSIRKFPIPAYVDVMLPEDLSLPVTQHQERGVKQAKAERVVQEFDKQIANINPEKLPCSISIEDTTFALCRSAGNTGPRFIHSSGIIVPSQKYVDRVRYITTLKAEKRATWTGADLKKKYIVAIECEQVMLGEEDVDEALLGYRETYQLIAPKTKIPAQVLQAASINWTGFLQKVHLIPTAKTIFTSYGVFLTEAICKHVSGVLVHWGGVIGKQPYFVPNPFAESTINDSRLTTFI